VKADSILRIGSKPWGPLKIGNLLIRSVTSHVSIMREGTHLNTELADIAVTL
jgi:hypothetical protein